ncbi:MAG: DUF5681 domain-containing protein [Prevotellaceae bacterium]|jgi:hypothetical protein|nr:DUF5681 domain-containing protein [Prevotellaceae bacterium]
MSEFQRGKSGNPKGRPKGSTNKNSDFIEALEQCAGDILMVDEIKNDINQLSPKERLDFLVKILPYICTKADTRIEVSNETPKNKVMNTLLERMTEACAISS